MSFSDAIPSIHSARLMRFAAGAAWLRLDLGWVQLRDITVSRSTDTGALQLVFPGKTVRNQTFCHYILSPEFTEIVVCLAEVMWADSDLVLKTGQLRHTIDWYAKARK